MMRGGITCLIPAYNEAARIGTVLAAVALHPAVDRVVVIDDGSSDGTAEVAAAAGAVVLRGPGNAGKTQALLRGLATVQTRHVMLLDADLLGLTADDIARLIAPVMAGRAAASISLRGNAPRTWRLLGVDYISGERVFATDLLAGQEANLARLPRFGFEVFLNRLLIARNAPVAVVPWPGVASPSKAAKRGWLRGMADDARMLSDIFHTINPGEVVSQIAGLKRLNRAARA